MTGARGSGPRDRDAAGRARNARPRDELGRPLPRSAAHGVDRVPDDLVVTPAEAAELGGRLLAEGRPFHAHEVFEAAWKALPGPERELWRGLAQIAVGLTHARRGNARGAAALLRRGAAHVREAGTRNQPGVNPRHVAEAAENIALRIERDGLAAVPESRLLLTLTPLSARHVRDRLVAALGRGGDGLGGAVARVAGHLGGGQRESGALLAHRGGEDHAVHGAGRAEQRAA